jgi:hypothetical protein
MTTSPQTESNRQAKLLARVLPDLVANGLRPEDDPEGWRELFGLDDPHISEAVLTELRPFIRGTPNCVP